VCLKRPLTASQIFSNRLPPGLVCCLLLLAAMVAFSGCTGKRPAPAETPATGLPAPEIVKTPGDSDRTNDSRLAASHNITVQGYQLLQKKDYDGAIRVLERAVGVNPGNGPGYFYLAQAWLEKENFQLAARFNEMAIMYLRNHPTWSQRARAQKEKIQKRKNNASGT